MLYENREEIGGFAGNVYWSSTELDYLSAWGQVFYNGTQVNTNKSYNYYVRSVRAS